jgi:hypothetical protein
MKTISRLTPVVVAVWLILSFYSIDASSETQSNNSSCKIYKFINGQWFNGKSFQLQTFYSVDGILTKKKPHGDFETIDLAKGFVVPPFAEAHNHKSWMSRAPSMGVPSAFVFRITP